MTHYFEIYVGGKNGFSAFIKTDKIPHSTTYDELSHKDEDSLITLAIENKIIEPGDLDYIVYVQAVESTDSENWNEV